MLPWLGFLPTIKFFLIYRKKNISPHSFRRSLATNLYNSGGKLETIQKQLGHSSLDTTLGYIHNDYQTLYADYSKLWQERDVKF